MRFLDDMNDKYGFQDGTAIPEGVDFYREVYVRCLNALLEKHGSGIRVIAYDRPGVDNPCLIVRTRLKRFQTLSAEEVLSGLAASPADEPNYDDAYDEAVEEAREAGIDEFVVIQARLDAEALEQFLRRQI